ncbi:replication regulatory protein RepA [Salmonella enterica]|nr:replication regulatory protein RepA [Salmonella enterica]
MSQQVENAVTFSSKPKRPYRKGNPLSAAERQQVSLARKKATHKEIRVFVKDSLKSQLQLLCKKEGITQAEMIEKLIVMGCTRQ